jgi:hypothetical protein
MQLTFGLDFNVNYAPHRLYPDLEGSVGIRYWFN